MTTAVRVPAGLRWSCHGCGGCCTGHDLGPVEPEVVTALEAAGIAEGWREMRPDGVYLRQVDGACVFLLPDRRCAVHARLGAAAKPGFCREFPYHLVEDDLGTAAVIRATCAGFWRSFRDGEPVGAEDVAGIAALARVVPRARFASPRVEVLPGQARSTADWLAGESALLASLAERDASPAALVAHVRGAIGVGGEARAAQYEAALGALTLALQHVMRGALATASGAAHQVAFARDALAMLEAAETPAPLDRDARAWLNLLLRSAILGKTWAAWGSVGAGLGVWLAGVEIARRTGRGDAEGLAPAIERWERLSAIPVVQLWLNKARPATIDVFLHAPP